MLNQAIILIYKILFFGFLQCIDVVWLLRLLLLVLLCLVRIEKTLLECFCWVEVNTLSHQGLLVLQHLLIRIFDQP